MKIVKADKKGIDLAVKYLKEGKSIVYPTDTAYGLGVDATNSTAARRLYKLKGRSFRKPVHVMVSSFAMAKKYAKFGKIAEQIFRKFLPGALTLVLNLSPNLSPRQGRGVRALSAGTMTLGIRMPDNSVALALVKKLNRAVTTTSANLAGAPTPYSVKDSLKQFRGKKYRPDLYLDAGKLPKRKPSTIVRIDPLTSLRAQKAQIRILRKGPISETKIRKVITPSNSPLS